MVYMFYLTAILSIGLRGLVVGYEGKHMHGYFRIMEIIFHLFIMHLPIIFSDSAFPPPISVPVPTPPSPVLISIHAAPGLNKLSDDPPHCPKWLTRGDGEILLSCMSRPGDPASNHFCFDR